MAFLKSLSITTCLYWLTALPFVCQESQSHPKSSSPALLRKLCLKEVFLSSIFTEEPSLTAELLILRNSALSYLTPVLALQELANWPASNAVACKLFKPGKKLSENKNPFKKTLLRIDGLHWTESAFRIRMALTTRSSLNASMTTSKKLWTLLCKKKTSVSSLLLHSRLSPTETDLNWTDSSRDAQVISKAATGSKGRGPRHHWVPR